MIDDLGQASYFHVCHVCHFQGGQWIRSSAKGGSQAGGEAAGGEESPVASFNGPGWAMGGCVQPFKTHVNVFL